MKVFMYALVVQQHNDILIANYHLHGILANTFQDLVCVRYRATSTKYIFSIFSLHESTAHGSFATAWWYMDC